MDITSSNITIDDLVIDHAVLYETIRKSLTRDPFDHYINGVCSLFICLLGTISNALSFSVLIRRTMRLSTYVYLAGLCLSDFTACFFLIPGCIVDAYPIEIPDYELPRTYAYTKLLIITGAISTTARALSVWLCVAFTIDRWIMICRPFVGPLYCTIKNARRVTLIIYTVGVFYAIPLMFEYEVKEATTLSDLFPNSTAKRIYRYKLSELGSNSIFRWTYVLINALGVYIIPLITIAILNRKLLNSIRLLEKRSAEYNAPLPTKQGVTIMLLATTLMLLVFRSPSATVSIMWLISAKMFIHEKPPFRLRKFHSIANLCATFNAATTFIMFIIYGTKFRSEFTSIYCSMFTKFKRRKDPSSRRQQQKHMRKLRTSNDRIAEETNVTDLKNKVSLTKSNQFNHNNNNNIHKESLPYNSSTRTSTTTTTTTATTTSSIASFLPMRHFMHPSRKQRFTFENEYNLVANSATNTPQSHEIIIREDETHGDNNDLKATSFTESYFDWFKSLIDCH